MKRLFLALSISASVTAAYAQERHVIVISVDGFRPEFYKDPAWGMVNLRQAMAGGAHADGVRGVFSHRYLSFSYYYTYRRKALEAMVSIIIHRLRLQALPGAGIGKTIPLKCRRSGVPPNRRA